MTAFVLLFGAIVRGTGRMALVGPAVILMSTLPVYSYFYVAPDLRATRYIYFASIGWAVLVTQLLTTVFVRRHAMRLAFASIVVILFVSLQLNARPWRTAAEIVTRRRSAIDGRTTRHAGYVLSQRKRKLIEQAFGWLKTVALFRKLRHRGGRLVDWLFSFGAAAYNLVRWRNLVAQRA